ncbi:MAG: BON domain-containing protein, partial [Myxococcales bacterium]|nr:BON domain-containing protein [Myxococcales bacterium]
GLVGAIEHEGANFSFTVEGGHVVLDGPATHRQSLRRTAEILGRIQGVRDVATRIHFPTEEASSRRGESSRIAQLVASVSPDDAVLVQFFEGVAVLSGTTQSLRAKRAVEAFVADDPAVMRVVNKIEVALQA